MTTVELMVRGEIAVMRLAPGDTIVVTFHDRITRDAAEQVKAQVGKRFPGHEVIIAERLSLSIQRDEVAA